LKELPDSDDPTISAISRALAKARQAVEGLDREARRRVSGNEPQQSITLPDEQSPPPCQFRMPPSIQTEPVAAPVEATQATQAKARDVDTHSPDSDHPYFRPSWAARRRARRCITPEAQSLPASSAEVVLSVGRTRKKAEESARRQENVEEKEDDEDTGLARQLAGELKHAARRRSETRSLNESRHSETAKLNEKSKGERKWKTWREEYNETKRPASIAAFWARLATMGETRGEQQFDSLTDEENELEDRLVAIETRRLFATRGQAPPLWSSMREFSGFRAARAYQLERPSLDQREKASETLPASNNQTPSAHNNPEADSERGQLSRRVRQPSRRQKEGEEGDSIRAERSASRLASRGTRSMASKAPSETSVSRSKSRAPGETRTSRSKSRAPGETRMSRTKSKAPSETLTSRTKSKAPSEAPASRPSTRLQRAEALDETARAELRSSRLRQPSRKAREMTATTVIETTVTEVTRRETISRKRRKTRGE
jgi:hypothetical protein